MNKARRKELERAQDLFLQAQELASQAKEILEQCRDDEQEYYDNMIEAFQNGEKGDNAQSAISAMEDAIGILENLDEGADFDQMMA